MDLEEPTQKNKRRRKSKKRRKSGPKPRVFMTYCPEDKAVGMRIAEILERVPYDVWYLDKSVKPGELELEETNVAIEQHDTAIVLLSRHSVKSKMMKIQIDRLVNRKLSSKREVAVFPAQIGNCEIPDTLLGRNIINMRYDFPKALISLLTHLDNHFSK